MFGVAADAIGVRSSCFMLMTLVVIVTMIWMWVAERNEREGILASTPTPARRLPAPT